jgi:hypothetical protein
MSKPTFPFELPDGVVINIGSKDNIPDIITTINKLLSDNMAKELGVPPDVLIKDNKVTK